MRWHLVGLLLVGSCLAVNCASSREVERDASEPLPVDVSALRARLTGRWLVTLHTHDLGSVRTILAASVAEDGYIEAHSREGALSAVVGGWKSFLARTFSDGFERGALLHLYAYPTGASGESIALKGKLVSAIGSFILDASNDGAAISGKLTTQSGRIWGTIEASRFEGTLPLRDYAQLPKQIEEEIQRRIFNPAMLEGVAGQEFRNTIRADVTQAQDDLDVLFTFFERARQFGVSHFGLTRLLEKPPASAAEGSRAEPPPVELTYPREGVARMRFRHFGGVAREIDDAFAALESHGAKALIIDLRDNPGGDFSCMRVASHLLPEPAYAGVLLANAWWRDHAAPPAASEYGDLPLLAEYNPEEFQRLLDQRGCLAGKVIPASPVLSMPMWVLTSAHTASAAEPIAALLQSTKRAVLVGERTAGLMLSSASFNLDGGWCLRVPVADYYTADGIRIEGAGVTPDVQVAAEQALDEALRLAAQRCE